ncbi:MAG: 4Fe-4S binding protein [Deltaproteobacteria bacterium]|nr:4Fe-4S binding protein [Deltaproteobacteria bacterium]
MGHIDSKGIFRKLGRKIDHLPMRAPWNEAFYQILKELYSEKEADVIVKMPYGLSDLNRIARVTKYESSELQKILEGLCSKGLVMDLWTNDAYHYMPSPMMIGIFEFTMMRTGESVDSKALAHLFHSYLNAENGALYATNFKKDNKISVIRALPHWDALDSSEYVEVLDYEKAASIIESSEKFSVGICSCRHEKLHVGEKECDVPLEKCSSFNHAADYLIRNNLAKEVSKTEMMENLAQSIEMKLVLCADNIKRNITFICHCCKDCCNALAGISKFGYPNTVVTSTFIAKIDPATCLGCGKCAKACPINAIEMVPIDNPQTKKKKDAVLNTSICLGCGVCSLNCNNRAVTLVRRGKRVLHPENTFERIILQCLERGTLQNQIFDNPQSLTQKFMRGFVGGFLKLPPVKAALMSDMLRSSFLSAMASGVQKQGKEWVTEM